MRLRFAVLASLVAALAVAAAPGVAGAAPQHNHGLTINATPNPIIVGSGRADLRSAEAAPWPVRRSSCITASTSHALHPDRPHDDRLARVLRVHACGRRRLDQPQLVRPRPGRLAQPHRPRARRRALVSIHADKTTTDTRQPVTFTGAVSPNHAFERVVLQEQTGVERRLAHAQERAPRRDLALLDPLPLSGAGRPRRARRASGRSPQHPRRVRPRDRDGPAGADRGLHDQHLATDHPERLDGDDLRRARSARDDDAGAERQRDAVGPHPRPGRSASSRHDHRDRRELQLHREADASTSCTRCGRRFPAPPQRGAVRGRPGRGRAAASSLTSTVGQHGDVHRLGHARQGGPCGLPSAPRRRRRLAHGRGHAS